MKTNLRQISGGWADGYVLDKHTSSSVYLGDDENGHPQFDTIRTEVGEAVFQLKYRGDWSQVAPLAEAIYTHIVPHLPKIGLIVPMPATHVRQRQPVAEVARELARLMGISAFQTMLQKNNVGAVALKNMASKAEKQEALAGRFSVADDIDGDGQWNALLIDDLFHTGASMEAACAALLGYPKIARVYVAAMSWR